LGKEKEEGSGFRQEATGAGRGGGVLIRNCLTNKPALTVKEGTISGIIAGRVFRLVKLGEKEYSPKERG